MSTFNVNHIVNPQFGRSEGSHISEQEKLAIRNVMQILLVNVESYNRSRKPREIGNSIIPPLLFKNIGASKRPQSEIQIFNINPDEQTVSIMVDMILDGFSHLKYSFKCGFSSR